MKDYGHPDPSMAQLSEYIYTVSELDEMPKKWVVHIGSVHTLHLGVNSVGFLTGTFLAFFIFREYRKKTRFRVV